MGKNKALLELGGQTLVERALGVLGSVCAEVAIAGGGVEMERFGRVVPDPAAGQGPLGGLVAALEDTAYEWNAVLAVDIPFVPASAWRQMLSWADGSNALAVVPRAGERDQPLCAVYSRGCVPIFRRELEAGRWRVLDALKALDPVDAMVFTEVEWFRNLNTPEDFSAAGGLTGELSHDRRAALADHGAPHRIKSNQLG